MSSITLRYSAFYLLLIYIIINCIPCAVLVPTSSGQVRVWQVPMSSHSGTGNNDLLVDDLYHIVYSVAHLHAGIRLELSTGSSPPRGANFSGVIVHYFLPLMALFR